jgi:hypothetical protein
LRPSRIARTIGVLNSMGCSSMSILGLEWRDAAVVIATFVGPIVAIQAQKLLERARENSGRKNAIFMTLLAYRRDRLAPQFVQALNAIDVAFYGATWLFGYVRWQTADERGVVSRWRTFLTHQTPDSPLLPNDPRGPEWIAAGDELFWNLLESMAKCLRYDFDRELLKRGGYLPEGHAVAELQTRAIREAVLGTLHGQPPLRISIVAQPTGLAGPAEREG